MNTKSQFLKNVNDENQTASRWLILFISIFLVSLFIHILLLILQIGNQLDLYFLNLNDFLADFLNPVRYTANRDPYFDETIHPMHHNNPGLFYIVCWCVKQIAGIESNSTLQDLWANHTVILMTFYYLIIQYLLIGHSIICLCKKFKTNQLILIPLMMSYPMLYTLERANHVLFTAACINYFIAFYDRDEQLLRLLSCLCLALAASMKIYPALFGFLYFEKKQNKEIVISALMTIFLFFVPFLFFKHGLNNFTRLLWNIKQFTTMENHSLFFSLVRLFCIFSLILSIFQKTLLERLICIIFPFLLLSTNAGFYTTLYFYPLIILLFNNNQDERYSMSSFYKYFFFIYFFCLLNPLQFTQYILPTNRNDNLLICFYSLRHIFLCILTYEAIKTIKSMRNRNL
ncbi:MAG: DUF2029 domain-containing protein [Spirochaetales bacterium]|nr:DUF2029 domain-containing protein [Spirochaetales bacterium]